VEKPKLLKCPGRIINETDGDSMKIKWLEPTYTDNCGKYPECRVTQTPNIYSGSEFTIAGSPYIVSYDTRDPSGNVNEECRFTVEIKKKPGIKIYLPSEKICIFL